MYYQCPDCGFKQKSEATTRITCHRCDRSYRPQDAKKTEKRPDDDVGTGFVRFSKSDDK